jgi:hypothetical protein
MLASASPRSAPSWSTASASWTRRQSSASRSDSARAFAFRRQHFSKRDRNSLITFWEGIQGAWQSFTYNVPNADQTTTPTTVTWEYAPLSLQYLANACQVGFNFIEVPTAGTTYQVNSTCTRFPSSTLKTALLSQVQQIIPLIHIRVREAAVPDIWISDRRCTLTDNASGAVQTAMGWPTSSQLYLPRVLGLGEPGSDTVISQDIKGTADNVQFTFGNADRVMTALANDTDLKFASIDLCLLHVNSNTILQLWKGFIVSYTTDGTPQFTVRCSDGLFLISLGSQLSSRSASPNLSTTPPWLLAQSTSLIREDSQFQREVPRGGRTTVRPQSARAAICRRPVLSYLPGQG